MNCKKCDAYREDPQTGDVYCKELGSLIAPGAVKCPRQQEKKSFREHIMERFSRTE